MIDTARNVRFGAQTMSAPGTIGRRDGDCRMSAFGGKADIADKAAMSAFDPKRTSASIACCGSEVGFQHYQSTRLSRYDALSGGWRSYEAAEFITLIGGAGAVDQTLVQGFLSY